MNQLPLELMRRSRVSRRILCGALLFAVGLGLADSALGQSCIALRGYPISAFGTGVFPLTNGDYAHETLDACSQPKVFEIPYIWIVGGGPIIQHLGANQLPGSGTQGGDQILVYT